VTGSLGSPRVHLRRTGSTNERARELALGGAPHGTLVTADQQTSGRGRQGRTWSAAPSEALLMSLVLRELDPMLPLSAAVAICEALPVDCAIKWPNDVWVDGRKLAGILVEGRPQEGWAVLGIGLNVSTTDFPPELAGTATSLHLAGDQTEIEAVLNRLLAALDRWLTAPGERVLAEWSRRDALRGEPVRWTGGEGTAAGIDSDGGLLVDTATGRVKLAAGEVHLQPR
jgi:BirA family transcriptional regulator, biotin operon repressor / biotin---[acetyl-CoA-carboxylase] ligase